ncbi:MAG: hypothetical protein ACXW4O_14765, partial [Candidatus Binatia bacterium]
MRSLRGVHFDVGVPDDLGPQDFFIGHLLDELIGRTAEPLKAKRRHLLSGIVAPQERIHNSIKLRN